MSYINVGVSELGASVARQHVDDDDLPPLIYIHQQVAQLAIVAVDQVYPLRTHLWREQSPVAIK